MSSNTMLGKVRSKMKCGEMRLKMKPCEGVKEVELMDLVVECVDGLGDESAISSVPPGLPWRVLPARTLKGFSHKARPPRVEPWTLKSIEFCSLMRRILFALVGDHDHGLVRGIVNDFEGLELHVTLNRWFGESSTDETLGVEEGVLWVHCDLVLGRISDASLGVFEGKVGWVR
uniref:Uncharacterized protein n=1 Tax=Fagus sylvatica TaxID=28930 RepID=A0A2N9IZT8_FAGSY